jgi:predicted kinase
MAVMTERLDPPALVLVTGMQGTGKSAIAGGVAEALHAPLLAWDWLMAGLTSFEPVQDAFRSMGREEYRRAGWVQLLQLARLQLLHGTTVVVDGLARAGEVEAVRALAAEMDARSLIVLTSCAVDVQRARVVGRRRDIPGWHELTWEHVAESRTRWVGLPDVDLEVDEHGTVAEHVAAVLARLRA